MNPLEDEARRFQERLVRRYTLKGLVLGLILMFAAWCFELILHQAPFFSFESIQRIHSLNPLLYLIDAGPILGAVLFRFIGRGHANLHNANIQLEELLQERSIETTFERAKANAILETAADGIVSFDEEGRIRAFNSAARRLFGYGADEVQGRDVSALVPMLIHDQRTSFLGLVRSMGLETGVANSRELTGLRKDGTEFPIEVDISKFDVGDETVYTAIVRDITERRRQDRLKKSLVEVTEAVNGSEDLQSLYRSILDSLGQVIYVPNLFIVLCDEDKFSLVYAVEEGRDVTNASPPLRETLLNLVVRRGEPVLLDQSNVGVQLDPEEMSLLPHRIFSWLGVPLVNQGETIGIMAIHSYDESFVYTEKDVWVVNLVSGQIASAISREQARESLRLSEKRYRRMIEEAGEIVYTTNLEGQLTYVNPQAIRLTGFSEEELLGHKSVELIDEDYRHQVLSFYAEQLKNGTRETTLEFPLITKDNEKVWIEQVTTLLYEGGQMAGFQSIVHDITERRHAEAALREREERFRSLSASSPIGIFQLDLDGQCIYANQRFETITGRSHGQLLGRGWFECIHPAERETFRMDWIFTRDDAAIAAREVRLDIPNGEEKWVAIRWTPTHDAENRVTGYVGTFEDITPRKKTDRINRVLYDISLSTQESDDLQEFFARLHTSLSTIIDTTNFYVALFDETTQMIRFPYAREEGNVKPLADRLIGKGLTGLVIRAGKTLLFDEKALQEVYASGKAALLGEPAKNWLGVPLIQDNKVVGAVIIQSYTDAGHYSQEDVRTMEFVSSQIASAIRRKQTEEATRESNRQLAEAHQRIKEELALAARIQQARLPKKAPNVSNIEFSWLFDSCEEVAGDMFNFVRLDDRHLAVYLFDVSGHGVAAALLSMSLSRALTANTDGSGVLLRQNGSGYHIASPAEVAEAMNERFPMNLDTNQYFTLIYGILNTEQLVFRFVRGGHPAPVLVTEGKAHELDVVCGPAIGIVPSTRYEEFEIQFSQGDKFVIYTDGLDESVDKKGEEFGLNRILQVLTESSSQTVSDQIRALRRAVSDFTAGTAQHDDITIVGFGIRGTN